MDFRDEVSGVNRVENREPPGGNHGFTTTTATVADETDPLPDIFAKLDEAAFVGLLQQIEPFRHLHGACDSVFDQRSGRSVERHADVQRSSTNLIQMLHLMTAITDADGPG